MEREGVNRRPVDIAHNRDVLKVLSSFMIIVYRTDILTIILFCFACSMYPSEYSHLSYRKNLGR